MPDGAFNRSLPLQIQRVKRIAELLDSAITLPVLRKKIGLDPVLGLLPGGGDAVMALIACYTLWVALELNLPPRVIFRLAVNILLDFLVGSIPVVGDVADAFWKTNQLNARLLEEAYWEHLGKHPGAAGEYQPQVVDVTVIDVAEGSRVSRHGTGDSG